MDYVRAPGFGRRVPAALVAKLQNRKLAQLRTTYTALQARLRDPHEPVSVAMLRRMSILRSILRNNGVAA